MESYQVTSRVYLMFNLHGSSFLFHLRHLFLVLRLPFQMFYIYPTLFLRIYDNFFDLYQSLQINSVRGNAQILLKESRNRYQMNNCLELNFFIAFILF